VTAGAAIEATGPEARLAAAAARRAHAYSSDQIIPVKRPFGGRWFDDVTIPRQMIDDLLAAPVTGTS
jgi:hypothetical protein